MATVKKKIVKASISLKRGGTVKKAQFGKTTPAGSCAISKSNEKADNAETRKANRLASMSDSRRARVEARMDRREERKADREERRNTPRSERSSRGPNFGFKTGGTIKKAENGGKKGKGASAVSSQSNCKGGDCKQDMRGILGPGPTNIFQKMKDAAESRRLSREEKKYWDKEEARREASRDTAAERRSHEAYLKREKEQGEDVSTAQRMSEARNKGKQFPYKDVNKIYDSLQNVRKYRSSIGPSSSTSAGGEEGKSTGEYMMGKYKKGGKLKKTGSKLVKKASSRSMKSGGMIKKSAVKKAVVKKLTSVKSKSKKK
jgi:hypothetical protein